MDELTNVNAIKLHRRTHRNPFQLLLLSVVLLLPLLKLYNVLL